MNMTLVDLKNIIKKISEVQKTLRPKRKASLKTYDPSAAEIMRHNKYELRHLHIAYCLLRGIPYEVIEKNVAENHQPSWSKIEKIKEEYSHAKVVCPSAS